MNCAVLYSARSRVRPSFSCRCCTIRRVASNTLSACTHAAYLIFLRISSIVGILPFISPTWPVVVQVSVLVFLIPQAGAVLQVQGVQRGQLVPLSIAVLRRH